MRQLLPGKDGTVMNLGLVKLSCGTAELGIRLALVEALAVTVVEGDVTYAGPAVLDYGCGMEFGHGFMVLGVHAKIPKNDVPLPIISHHYNYEEYLDYPIYAFSGFLILHMHKGN